MRVIRGRLVTGDQVVEGGWVAIDGDRIAGVGRGDPPPSDPMLLVEVAHRLVTPGFVDVHVHGGDGAQVAGDDPAVVARAVAKVARFHARHGTTCLLAATVSDTPERLSATVAGVGRAVRRPDPLGAAVAGVHLEGPWLAPGRCGAHAPELLRRPDAAELAALVEASGATVRIVTVAPELDGSARLIAAAVAGGLVVSVGHTEADYETVIAAFDAGARHVTHLGNAMGPLDRRRPGPIGAALTDRRVTVEVIADGEHVHPALLRLVASVAASRTVLVTDAVAAAGMPDGDHHLGRLPVTVAGGRVVLADRPSTLAGSVLTMDRAVHTLVGAGVPVPVAVRAATTTPAALVGPDGNGHRRGVLLPGAAADLVVLGEDGYAEATVIGGRTVHDPGGLLDAWGASQ